MARLNDVQRRAIRVGSRSVMLGRKEVRVEGSTMVALERRGLATVETTDKPYRRMVYRLTAAGNELRVQWLLAEQEQPVAHTPVAVRCTHCGAEYPDGTPGGSCGACGLEVEAVA